MKSGLVGIGMVGIVAVVCAGRVAVAASPADDAAAVTEYRVVEALTHPGARIELDVPIGSAGAQTVSATKGGGAVMDLQGTGDITPDNRRDEFDAVVMTVYGLSLTDSTTPAQLARIYDASSKLARRRRSFIKAKSGETVRVEFPATIQ